MTLKLLVQTLLKNTFDSRTSDRNELTIVRISETLSLLRQTRNISFSNRKPNNYRPANCKKRRIVCKRNYTLKIKIPQRPSRRSNLRYIRIN